MHIWHEGMQGRQEKDGAYWERNMLALMLAKTLNNVTESNKLSYPKLSGLTVEAQDNIEALKVNSGWYYDLDNNWDGWKRVVSLENGNFGFHVPDELNLGSLVEIEPNWDGHTTEEKWLRALNSLGIADKRSVTQWSYKFNVHISDLPDFWMGKGNEIWHDVPMTQDEFKEFLVGCQITINLKTPEQVRSILERGESNEQVMGLTGQDDGRTEEERNAN